MSENSKSLGKTISVICCVAAALLVAAAITVKCLTGGQIRTVDNAFTAIAHDIYADYSGCYAENAERLSEADFNALRTAYTEKYGEDFSIETRFLHRDGISPSAAKLTVKITVHNDDISENSEQVFHLVKEDGKWRIA